MELHVAAGTAEGAICGFELELKKSAELKLLYGYNAHSRTVRDVALDGPLLMSAGVDEAIRMYNIQRRVEIGELIQHSAPVNCVSLLHRKYALSGSDDGDLYIWRCRDWEMIRKLRAHKKGVLDADFHPDGNVAVTIGADGLMKLWDLVHAKEAFKTATTVNWIDGGEGMALSHGKSVSIYDIASGKVANEVKLSNQVLSVSVISKNVFAAGGQKGELKVFDLRSGKDRIDLKGHSARVKALSSVGNLLFSADTSGLIKGWLVDGAPQQLCEANVQKRLSAMCAGTFAASGNGDDDAAESDDGADDDGDEESSDENEKDLEDISKTEDMSEEERVEDKKLDPKPKQRKLDEKKKVKETKKKKAKETEKKKAKETEKKKAKETRKRKGSN